MNPTEAKLRKVLGMPPAEKRPDTACVVCRFGKLVAKSITHERVFDHNTIIGGPRQGPWTWKTPDGFTCNHCGVHYDKKPRR